MSETGFLALKEAVAFQTPAKINIFLSIQGKRMDGYHDVLLDLIPISVFDHIRLRPPSAEGIQFQCNCKGIDPRDNLLLNAIWQLEKTLGLRLLLSVDLEKTIPIGAGLGGGSGNAAGMLVVLNDLFALGLTETELKGVAEKIGADVPFFVSPQACHARGIGDELSPMAALDPWPLLLIYPGFPISTAEAYQYCHISARLRPLTDYSPRSLARQTPDINDFWDPLSQRYPGLKVCRDILLAHGAVFAGLSGSGSTVFGIFKDVSSRDTVRQTLTAEPGWRLFSGETLHRYRYKTQVISGL